MFEALLRWASARATAIPFAPRLSRTLEHGHLCLGPYTGPRVRPEARLEAMQQLVRWGRLPKDTNLPRLAQWLDELYEVVGNTPPARPRRVLLFSTLPFWVQFCIPISLVLAARGCLVDFAWLPYYLVDREQHPDPEVQPPAEHLLRLFPALQLHPRLRLINLLHVPPREPTEAVRAAAREFSKGDPPYIVRRELFDIETDPEARALYAFRCIKNLDCMARIGTLLRQRYDSLLIPHGGIYEYGAAYQAGRLHGIPCVTFDVGDRKNRIIVSNQTPCVQFGTDPEWQADVPHVLTPEREAVAMRWLLRREKPNWEGDEYTWSGQIVADQSDEQLRADLGLSPDKPVALLCTNVAWDAAQMATTWAFPSMTEWVLATVGWFLHRPNCQLVVRAHPGEITFGCKETVPDLIAARYPSLPDHIRVIRAGDPINTYSLMRLSRFGLVYASTTGMEMAARGIPVIVAGRIHYAARGFTTDPTTEAEYFAALERAASGAIPARLSRRELDLARCYAYVYFEHYPKPFPWKNVLSPDEELQAWPLQRLFRGDCPPEFLDTFDYLAGFLTSLPRQSDAARNRPVPAKRSVA